MKHVQLPLACFCCFVIFSCGFEPEYSIPDLEVPEIGVQVNSTLKTLANAYEQSGLPIFSFDKDENFIVKAYVISSDEAGNFYKLLVVQDSPEDPSQGAEIKIDLRSYYTKYNFGRKIFLDM